MAEHNDFGAKGENLALEFLAAKGYKILETNWHSGHAEIDIIAQSGPFLVVVEVKARGSDFTMPQEAVNKKKQRLLVKAAENYVLSKNISLEVRFDIVTVVSYNGKFKITHIENAFYPLL